MDFLTLLLLFPTLLRKVDDDSANTCLSGLLIQTQRTCFNVARRLHQRSTYNRPLGRILDVQEHLTNMALHNNNPRYLPIPGIYSLISYSPWPSLLTLLHYPSTVMSPLVNLAWLTSLLNLSQTTLKSPSLPLPDAITRNWGAYSPFFSLAEYSVPDGCVVTQVKALVLFRS